MPITKLPLPSPSLPLSQARERGGPVDDRPEVDEFRRQQLELYIHAGRDPQLRAAAEQPELAAASGMNISANYILAVVIGAIVH